MAYHYGLPAFQNQKSGLFVFSSSVYSEELSTAEEILMCTKVTTLTRVWSQVSPGCSDFLIKASASLNHSTNHDWVCSVAGTLWGTGTQLCPVQRNRRALSYFPHWLVHVFATIFKTKLSKFVVFLLSLRRFLERIPSFLIFQSLFFVFPSLSHH